MFRQHSRRIGSFARLRSQFAIEPGAHAPSETGPRRARQSIFDLRLHEVKIVAQQRATLRTWLGQRRSREAVSSEKSKRDRTLMLGLCRDRMKQMRTDPQTRLC